MESKSGEPDFDDDEPVSPDPGSKNSFSQVAGPLRGGFFGLTLKKARRYSPRASDTGYTLFQDLYQSQSGGIRP
jgi:hypothetical protein